MELKKSRNGSNTIFGPGILGMNASPTHPSEPEIKHLGMRGIYLGTWNEFGLRIRRVEFTQGISPVVVKIPGAGISPAILFQFGQRLVEGRHRKSANQRKAASRGSG
jgi:hypothetical protein